MLNDDDPFFRNEAFEWLQIGCAVAGGTIAAVLVWLFLWWRHGLI